MSNHPDPDMILNIIIRLIDDMENEGFLDDDTAWDEIAQYCCNRSFNIQGEEVKEHGQENGKESSQKEDAIKEV